MEAQLVREELSDTPYHREKKTACRCGEVYVLADAGKADFRITKPLQGLPLNPYVPRPSVNVVDHCNVEVSGFSVAEQGD